MGNWVTEHKSISIGGGIAVLTTLGQIFSDHVKLSLPPENVSHSELL